VGILISLFQSLVSIADGDDYWAEGGMPLSTESSVD